MCKKYVQTNMIVCFLTPADMYKLATIAPRGFFVVSLMGMDYHGYYGLSKGLDKLIIIIRSKEYAREFECD